MGTKRVEYIKSQKRQYITVDLSKPEEFTRLIAEITQRSQVYISYSNNKIDAQIYNQLANLLQNKQFNIFNSRQNLRFREDGSYHDDIILDIQTISRDGYFMPIISETYLNDQYSKAELLEAKKCNANIIPYFLDFKLSENELFNDLIKIDSQDIISFVDTFINFDQKRNK